MPAAVLLKALRSIYRRPVGSAAWVHFYRNVFSHVPATKVRDVSHMLKAIHAQESREAPRRRQKRSSRICGHGKHEQGSGTRRTERVQRR